MADQVHLDPNQSPIYNPTFLENDGSPLVSPFKLESKEAKVILIEVGVAIAREVWEKVEKQIEVGKDLPYQQEDKIFENAGLMKFGQMAPSKEDPGAYGKGGRIIYYRMWISKEDGGRAEETFDITGF